MIKEINNSFILSTNNTSYAFRVMETGQLEHLYYGRKIRLEKETDFEVLTEKHSFSPGNTNVYDKEHGEYSLEDVCLEMSSYGKGDIREPFISIIYHDGSSTSDFVYDTFVLKKGKKDRDILPGSYDEGDEVEHLIIKLVDKNYGVKLDLHYFVYEKEDVIARYAKVTNSSSSDIRLERCMSLQFDFDDAGYVFTSFNGAWAREMNRNSSQLAAGKYVNSSFTGTSSNRSNPFVMVSRETTSEDAGDCYGFNLIYSGNHYESMEISSHGKTRITTGINPENFSFVIKPGESFDAPEAVMSYSCSGYNGMSQNMHEFIKEHIIRGQWKNKTRPVLLNSWEAAYFDINEQKLLKLAKKAKEAGVELFVMDDGWFGKRDNDSKSLGDWYPDKKKLPHGVDGLCNKINKLGLDFGIWVEPEMVNTDSELYRLHPDWTLSIPDKSHSEGRNQRLLDLTRAEVQDYIIDSMTRVFQSANISYVKWDMNRTFSDYYSTNLSNNSQGELAHRYVLGLYRCMRTLTERFPNILFEGCASGGNRFDLGILCYFPQIWGSDNSDAISRIDIQSGYSYGYPMSSIGAHVSNCPNHQTLRNTPIDTRFNIACFGVLGYECNLCDMKKEELEEIKQQIALYKQWRDVLQWGSFYRGRNGNITEWTCVAKDKSKAVGMIVQKLVTPNKQYEYYQAKGLNSDFRYHFYNSPQKHNVKKFGDLVNTVAPIHVKPDSFVHNVIAKHYKLEGESEDYEAYGDVLMNSHIKLKQAFSGTGYNENVRHFQDFSSRLYFMEKTE